jgi:hypothetical protein
LHNVKGVGGNEDTAHLFIVFALYGGGWSHLNPGI